MNFLSKLAASAFFLVWAQQGFSQTQVVNLNTGVDISNNVITFFTTPDPKWSVKLPNSTTFNAAYCGSGITSYGAYIGKNPTVGWICPIQYLSINGQNANAPAGAYDYKLNFESEYNCSIESAEFQFTHIGGDNEISEIFVNGQQYTSPNYTFSNWFNGNLVISNQDIIAGGLNTIIVRVTNTNASWGEETPRVWKSRET